MINGFAEIVRHDLALVHGAADYAYFSLPPAMTPSDIFFFAQILILLACEGNVNQPPCRKPKRKLPSAN
jgi:hypothetical protein